MKNITISKKDIRKNEKYKVEVDMLGRSKIDFEMIVSDAVEFGSCWERNCKGNVEERWNKRREYINRKINLYNERQVELLNKILELLLENIAMRQVLREEKISLYWDDADQGIEG
jgi:adenylate kinase family enzyme